MPNLTVDELADLLHQLKASTEQHRDELLTDLLVVPWPTKAQQDN